MKEEQKSYLELQYDIETVSSESGEGPVLLSNEGNFSPPKINFGRRSASKLDGV